MLHVQVGNYWADQWPYGCSFNLFIEFISEREVCIVQTDLPQKFNDILYWQCRLVQQGIILFQPIFNNVEGWIYG